MKNSWSGNMNHKRPPIIEDYRRISELKGSEAGSSRQQVKQPRKKNYPVKSSYHRSKQHYSFKRQEDINCEANKTVSVLSHHHEDFYRDMEQTLKGQNSNLKEHNEFLLAQIKHLFERQKKFKKALWSSKEKIKKLQNINQRLQSQFTMLTSTIVAEIERMQKLIQAQKNVMEEEIINSGASELPESVEGIGSQTEITLNHNLQQLKQRVNNIFNQNLSRVTTDCQHSGNFPNLNSDSRISNQISRKSQSSGLVPAAFQEINRKFLSKQDQFESYLPLNSRKQEQAQYKRSLVRNA